MSLGKFGSRQAVLKAIHECDELGRDQFLAKYGFGPAKRYFLDYGGKLYDSKAIIGAAYGYAFPDEGALPSDCFSGGEKTVQKKLEELGFTVTVLKPE